MNFNITQTDFLGIALALSLILVIVLLWKLHISKKNRFNVADLVCDTTGRINERKFCRFGAWAVSTWGFVYLIMDQRFSEWYFVGYMAAWVGNAIIGQYLNKDRLSDQQASKSTPAQNSQS